MRWCIAVAALSACSDYDLRDDRDAGPPVWPDIVADPPTVDFATVPEGTVVSRSLRIANRGGAPLDVSALVLGPNPAFSFPAPPAAFEVPPGGAVLQEIRYVATNATDASWVSVYSDDPDTPQLDVPLVGGALVPVLEIEPDPLSFGEIACREVGSLALHNVGGAPLTVAGVLVTGEKYTLATTPVLPIVVPPGSAAMVDVAFEPGPGADLHLGEVQVDSDDPRGVQSASLEGWGIAPPGHVDVFEQVENDWTRLDLLFFVDQSGSMGDDAANLAANFDLFIDILITSGIDYQVLAVTADSGCHNGPMITPSTPNAAAEFSAGVQGAGGTWTEAGMIVTRNAFQTATVGCNAGFLRPGVTPIAILVSDEPEQSPGGYSQYLNELLVMAPDLVISTIVGQPGSPCAENGTGYHESSAATGGADLEICNADWGTYFYEILGVIEPPLSVFTLSSTPDPATIVVTIDGAPAAGWAYDTDDNAVVFDQLSLPPPASVIEVAYDEAVTCF